MKYTEVDDQEYLRTIITVEISDLEMVGCRPYPHESALLRSVKESSSVADKLLALETIARILEREDG